MTPLRLWTIVTDLEQMNALFTFILKLNIGRTMPISVVSIRGSSRVYTVVFVRVSYGLILRGWSWKQAMALHI